MRPPIHSKKHYFQVSLTAVGTGTRVISQIAVAVEGTSADLVNEVVEGSLIKAVYVEMWGIGSVSDQFFTACIIKLEGGFGTPSVANLAALGDYTNKKNILYTTQGLASNDGIAGPYPLFKGWIKIPKGKQRFGLGDQLIWVLSSRGSATITECGFMTYKEYT